MLDSTTEASTSVRGVSDISLLGRAGGCAVFPSGDSSFDDDESSESGDGGSEVESGISVWARFVFAGANRADNMPSTTLRNFNGWGAFGGVDSEGV